MAGPSFNDAESPLTRLATRRTKQGVPFLSEAEVMAGERLRADFTRAALTPSITQRWEREPRRSGVAKGAADLSDTAIDARQRVDQAVRVIGPELSGVCLDVCCFLKGVELVERERQWPPRSAKLLLKAGLGILARHYGFEREVSGGRRRSHHWGADDYRPTVGGKPK
ncbi:DUF6456 domain-containing protein [Mangrovicella endophytica]|uniref:DUF6456 domain-containing protein n=1 Tax=Mangrovicella endophytica TaxID=2066697 RepID=UPI000C9DEB9E|nr:DUF6456 domain-containing protein [Mangrovicella endophytica]